jgi:DNA-binding PadR family transcriptional regulator
VPRAHQWQEGLGDVGRPEGYAELRRLADEELVQADAEGPRGRKAYRITDAGLAEIRRWLTSTEVDHTIRVQPLLRSLFFWLMDPEDLRAHLDAEARFFAESAAFYRTYADAKDHGAFGDSPQMRSMHVTVEAGIRLYEALASWAEWAKTVPPRRRPARRFPPARACPPAPSRPVSSMSPVRRTVWPRPSCHHLTRRGALRRRRAAPVRPGAGTHQLIVAVARPNADLDVRRHSRQAVI